MSGIYIHIPFCNKACHYCNFHFSTNLSLIEAMTDAICKEIALRANNWKDSIKTIYLGGGTPSLLRHEMLAKIFETIHNNFDTNNLTEITLEANPEDITKDKLESFIQVGITRLSIGIQSFDNEKLKWMNRAHTSEQARLTYKLARENGFNNINLDLIYALPDRTKIEFENEIDTLLDLDPAHISLYGLTIEEQTVFGDWEQKKRLRQMPDDLAADEYLIAVRKFKEKGYDHYEVSNFCKPGFESKHNSNYWNSTKYLGIGPGAHSFDGIKRQININNNPKYIKQIISGARYYEIEELTDNQRLNEIIFTGIRTSKGVDLNNIKSAFGDDLLVRKNNFIKQLINKRLATIDNQSLKLTSVGFLTADEIALELIIE